MDDCFITLRAQEKCIAEWVSSSFRDGHPSKIVGFCCGSFNWSCLLRFEDKVEWLLRFGVPGKVKDRDEKLRREVAVMTLIREKTKIPVPEVQAWGLSTENPLGLGPFIIMDFVPSGESLGRLWSVSETNRALRPGISTGDMRKVFRQIAEFYLELSELEFPNIGSLSIGDDQSIRSDLGPLTLKMQEIEEHGDVKTGGDCLEPFSSTSEYFSYIAAQDMQLCEQPNSVEGLEDARAKYKFHHQVNAITSRFVAKEHDKTGFRLVCDDFRYENLIVNNDSDLKIISVIDWEWTYAAPYQMFSSAPRWLAVTPPIMWDMPNGFQRIQYHGFLEIFLEELECEERKRIEAQPSLEHNDRLSDLMRESMRNGKFWFHELMYGSFTPANNPAWKVICKMHPDILSTPLPALEVFEDFKIRQRAASKAEWKVVKNKKKKK